MPPRRVIFLSTLVLAVAAPSPAAALGAANGTDGPVKGKSTSTAIVNLDGGAGTIDGSGQLTHAGKFAFHDDFTLPLADLPAFTFTSTETVVAANGDEIFVTHTATGTLTVTGVEITSVGTITGGTGRFADASGTFTVTSVGGAFSIDGSFITQPLTNTWKGQISY
jgi:hypothetical protein